MRERVRRKSSVSEVGIGKESLYNVWVKRRRKTLLSEDEITDLLANIILCTQK